MSLSTVELLDATGVTPGSYVNPNLTVTTDGRITSIVSDPTPGPTGPQGLGGLQALDDISASFNGVTTTFLLTYFSGANLPPTVVEDDLVIFVGGAVQSAAAFSWNSATSQITFSEAPLSGDYFVGFVANTGAGGPGPAGPVGPAGPTGPTGTVIWWSTSTAPVGFLTCNGAAVSRATYSDLFDVIGSTFGNGDGSTTFNLPDLRAEFIRGWDNGRGVDPGRVFGSAQADAFESHTHASAGSGSGSNGFWQDWPSGPGSSQVESSTSSGIWLNSSPTTASAGGTETRPRNVALLPCIKF